VGVLVDFDYLLILVLQWWQCVLDRRGNSYRLFNILQSFMFRYDSIYYFSYMCSSWNGWSLSYWL